MALQPTMIQLSEHERALLADAATAEGVSRSELMRRALRHYLKERTEARVSRLIREGYEAIPEADTEMDAAIIGARRMLSDPDLEW